MSTNSINSLSTSYLPSTLSTELTNNSIGNSYNQASGNGQLSPFAQMLSSAGSSNDSNSTGSSSSSENPNQMLNQLLSSFQSSAIQNQSQSLDPMSIA